MAILMTLMADLLQVRISGIFDFFKFTVLDPCHMPQA